MRPQHVPAVVIGGKPDPRAWRRHLRAGDIHPSEAAEK
jgi:hypothetical protein